LPYPFTSFFLLMTVVQRKPAGFAKPGLVPNFSGWVTPESPATELSEPGECIREARVREPDRFFFATRHGERILIVTNR
jgi:hypothetical protein